MKKIQLNNGYVAFEVRTEDLVAIGDYEKCHNCNDVKFLGYLVPVLDQFLCEKCLKEWERTGKYYPEYIPVEQKNSEHYAKLIKLIN